MRSFSEYRKQCIQHNINNLTTRSQSEAMFEMLRQDLMENIELPELLTESNMIAKSDLDRKSTRLNSSHIPLSRMPSSA